MASQSPPLLPFLDPAVARKERIEDLIGRLTLLEKIGQLMHDSPAVPRLGVPAYNWWNEACHGVGRNGRATVFPQVIGLAATWNQELVGQVATAISDEARAKHHAALAKGRRGQYQGLTFWTPNINIFRDPRWGRGQETFGEDPFLTGELGAAMVQGLQGDDPNQLKTAACAKHFAVHSGPEQARHEFDARPSDKDFLETYLPAFRRLVDAGVESVMGAYNRTYGEACCASHLLLEDILRNRWKFTGHVVSDCGALDDLHRYHKVTPDAAESSALALRRGCDLNCGCTYNDLFVAVKDGLISEAEVDRSLSRLLDTRFKLGLLDGERSNPWSDLKMEIVDGPAHRLLARRTAAESIVLLKNTGNLLPLSKDVESLLVTGPTGANIEAMIGNYFGFSSRIVTIAEGLAEAAEEGTRLVYRSGCSLAMPPSPGVNYTFQTAAENEVTIAVLGLDPTLEGEEGDSVASITGGDRAVIELPPSQLEFLKELRKFAKKLILVVTGGSPVAIPEAHELCDAVLAVWYPGCEGGRAVADVIFGKVAPSGRLPVTVPMRTMDLPDFLDYSMKGRTYRFAEKTPLYPFGFGLGYSAVKWSQATVSSAIVAGAAGYVIRTAVTNLGSRETADVAQCYIEPPQSWPNAPRATLVAFKKVVVPAGQSVQIEFLLPESSFEQYDASGRKVRVSGQFGVVVGSASPGPRAVELGSPPPARAVVTLP